MKIEKIYMIAPAGFKTGGTELAHQLVKFLLDKGIPSEIAYTDVKDGIDPIHPEFREYVSSWISVQDIPDKEGIILIVPEIDTLLLGNYHNVYKIIWWMSVDNFEKNSNFFGAAKRYGCLRAIKRSFCGQIVNKMHSLKWANLHLYQSEYARMYLEKLGIKNILPLSDYINDVYFDKFQKGNREDYVLYNPKKGSEFTKKLIKAFPNFRWKPIENMTTEQVRELLRHSKIYIDFGNHPGKDRFPREAAVSGCCVITGMRGSAGNSIDICIPASYKFHDNRRSIPLIGAKIEDCINNYELRGSDFNYYRKQIYDEKNRFEQDVINIIKIIGKDT